MSSTGPSGSTGPGAQRFIFGAPSRSGPFNFQATTPTAAPTLTSTLSTVDNLVSFNNHACSDTTLVMNSGKLMYADSDVLCRASPFFRAHDSFSNNAGTERSIEVKHICDDDLVFARVLLWMYTQRSNDLGLGSHNLMSYMSVGFVLELDKSFYGAMRVAMQAISPLDLSLDGIYMFMKRALTSEEQVIHALTELLRDVPCQNVHFYNTGTVCNSCSRANGGSGTTGPFGPHQQGQPVCSSCLKCAKHCNSAYVYILLHLPAIWIGTVMTHEYTYDILDVRRRVKAAVVAHSDKIRILLDSTNVVSAVLNTMSIPTLRECLYVIYGNPPP
ncbi:uncharacterized protein EV422DRAFT_539792 [Fimicolochytrium jonesii]|uniref:uncharacterized protein n=1 Tax=Fimicolochytrium jonesii TaxID=1396493 RepID=UPI0022FF0FBE|nr:uncharacterized protein EV422DRAFT_539792 [Fimicolochytrium jonesii]KAI8818058.1 hypothetical protein EV422DRAFT_539792 [Fimicolochytrium jonesii]